MNYKHGINYKLAQLIIACALQEVNVHYTDTIDKIRLQD